MRYFIIFILSGGLMYSLLELSTARNEVNALEKAAKLETVRVDNLTKKHELQIKSLVRENKALSIMQCSGVSE